MLIEVRAAEDRLRGPKAVDIAPVLASVLRAARETGTDLDLSRLRVVCDWVQYKHNFREPVGVRAILPPAVETARASRNGDRAAAGDSLACELAIDLRRSGALDDLESAVLSALTDGLSSHDRLYLEPWVPGSRSCIWDFNVLYWRALALWEQSTGRGYEQALPGGESDARNVAAARELILHLFAIWDGLFKRRALPEELRVLELGVGNGSQARVWLDEFVRLDRERGTDYYRSLHYLMGDYSPHVLQLARENVRHHGDHVSGLVLEATRPTETLGFLRYKAFLVYISNVYDNLPTDEIVRCSGHLFLVEVRAYLPTPDAERIADLARLRLAEVPDLVSRLLRLGPELLAEALPERFPTPLDAVAFWRGVWEALRLEERYIPLEELDAYEVAPEVRGELLRPIVEANGDIRMHVSNGAVASFAETLQLLHPLGLLQCHDLFVTDIHQYATGFRGPGKYDGSVVNWVNGRLLETIGSRRGFEVGFAPFAHGVSTNVLTLTACVRE